MRIPGVHKNEVPALVREILRRVQHNLRGSARVGHCDVAELRLKVPANVKRPELVDRIVKDLTEALR